MAAMDPTITLKAGIRQTLGRAFGGESMVINTFTADRGPGEVIFAPGAPGDAMHYHLDMNTLMVQRGAFVAHTDGVELTGKWQGAKGFFSGKGLVLLQASGTGDLFFNSYGAILEIDVRGEYIVDTGYVVAFENTLNYNVDVLPGLKTGGKIKSFLFGGEGGSPSAGGLVGALCADSSGLCADTPAEPPDLSSWEPVGSDLTTPRVLMGFAAASPFLIIAGGDDGSGPLDSVERTTP